MNKYTKYVLCLLGLVLCCKEIETAHGQAVDPTAARYRSDRILIRPFVADIPAVHAQLGTRVYRKYPLFGNIQVVELPSQLAVEDAIAAFEKSGLVEYAEPDYIGHPLVTPNDPRAQTIGDTSTSGRTKLGIS